MREYRPAAIGARALYYEQFESLTRWRSPSRTVTETDALMFAGTSGDMASLCFDAGHPTSLNGRRINTACALALATGLEQRLGLKEGTGIAFLGATWACHRPLYVNDTVHIEQSVSSKRPTKNEARGIVTFDVSLKNSFDDILCRGVWTLMVSRSPAIASPHATVDSVIWPKSARAAPSALGSAGLWDSAQAGIRIGDSWTTPSRTVTETDIATFCGLTGDYNPAHSDIEFARESPFGQRILQGPAGLAIAVGLESRLNLRPDFNQKMIGIDWTFAAPIFAGDTLRSIIRIKASRTDLTLLDVVVLNQRDESVQKGEWTMATGEMSGRLAG
jgi:acyl dehydratase